MRDSLWSIDDRILRSYWRGLCQIQNFSAISAFRKMSQRLLPFRTPKGIFRKRRQRLGARMRTEGLLSQASGNQFGKAIHQFARFLAPPL